MRLSKLFQAVLVGAAALWMGTGGAFAVCGEFGGFAIYQCSEQVYIDPPPFPVTFATNGQGAGRVDTGATAIFWQIGFGNHNVDTGLGSAGTGNSGLTAFNGNDQGLWVPDIGEIGIIDSLPGVFPAGALCLANNNFGNTGIDGCCDNDRGTLLNTNNDDILNPSYDVYGSRNGYQGYYSRSWWQDYPVAFLVQSDPDKRWFVYAAVATRDRGGDGTSNGPCSIAGGTNDAACDFSVGSYNLKTITNGNANPIVGGNNVLPWQEVPRPKAFCTAGCSGVATRTINFQWNPVRLFNDGSHRRSAHPNMGGDACSSPFGACGSGTSDATRASGVGVVDMMVKTNTGNNWDGLVRYDLQSAPVTAGNLDPNGRLDTSTLTFATVTADIRQGPVNAAGDRTTPVAVNGLSVAPDTCFRTVVKFGKKPETTVTNTANCRLGKCGDLGITASSLDPATITCVGGALFAEDITSASARKSRGSIDLTWTTGAELSVHKFNVYGVTNKGQTLLFDAPCAECSTGLGHTYTQSIKTSQVPGVKSFVVEMISDGGTSSKKASF